MLFGLPVGGNRPKKPHFNVYPIKSLSINGESFLSLLRRYTDICFGRHSQTDQARKKNYVKMSQNFVCNMMQ